MNRLPPHQAERRRCVASDAARKRSARKWINRNMRVPPSLWRREVEEFDLLHGLHGYQLLPPPLAPLAAPAPPVVPAPATPSASWTMSSSSGSGLAAPPSPLTPGPQEREVAVDADGFELYDPAAFEGSVSREDFVPDDFLETVTGAVLAWSEDEQDRLRRKQDRLRREQAASGVNTPATARDKGKAVVIYLDDDDSE